MANPAGRLITLIMLMQTRSNQKAAALAGKLGVSVRTLHRYFGMLDEMGIPVYSERGPYGGFSLVRGYRMPPLAFTPEEAAAVYLGASLVSEMWGSLYAEAAAGALAKLDNTLPNEQRAEIAWARRSLVAKDLHQPGLDALTPLLERLRKAIREQRRVSLVYSSAASAEPTRREFDAYALVYRWGWWYVVGYCHLRRAERVFRVDRIQDLHLADGTYQVPPEFDVDAFLEKEFSGQPVVLARLRFAPEAAHIARHNHVYWESLTELPGGAVEVEMHAPDLSWAASSALMYGPAVEVLAPPELRRMVTEWVERLHQAYHQI
ncbi:MAG TPA: YafY family protein [Anaerolineaceae bacterium]